ncbi:chloramphenicol acetyltransferase [Rufibacter radiotolerans]|uniref:Chloramphenicol acetyltransferase n=1 Tax=Rufibacter radiotolerans TaxID=1379910 RepID=A0A0H4VHZ8_9BACT|nr:CatA-like O-acetyltransferase [Rufibacter radiotolerans]AKQ44993.1 chloramphenicol acetyltransferase [Rufibacter radiotolerans]
MTTKYPKTIIPLEGWEREEQFRFFQPFTQPFFNVHTEIDISPLYHYCKREGLSVFLAYLFVTRQAACATPNFLLRIEEGQIVQYAGLDLSTTVLKNDQTIAFVHLPHQDSLLDFCNQARDIIAEVQDKKGLFHGYQGNDNLHLTTLPWFTFKGMEHAFSANPADAGIPKFAFGKLVQHEDQITLPLSIAVHHALADGYHIHLLLEHMNAYISAFEFLD